MTKTPCFIEIKDCLINVNSIKNIYINGCDEVVINYENEDSYDCFPASSREEAENLFRRIVIALGPIVRKVIF